MNMTSSQRLKILFDSGKTVFRLGDLESLWKLNPLNVKISAGRMVKKGVLLNLARGYYSFGKEFDPRELANMIVSPSYISFNTALFFAGVNFQQKNTYDSVATFGYSKAIAGCVFSYYAMKQELFFNLLGVSVKANIAIASAERAVLDSYYFGFTPDIDVFDKLDLKFLKELSCYYPLTVQKKAGKLYGAQV